MSPYPADMTVRELILVRHGQSEGNVAAEAVPMALAHVQNDIQRGQRVLLMGVGSGLNTAMMEVEW